VRRKKFRNGCKKKTTKRKKISDLYTVKTDLPLAFCERIRQQFSTEASELLNALNNDVQSSVHSIPYRSFQPKGTPVPWFENGTILPEKPTFTLDPLFHSGCYYPQESSSMVVGWILQQLELPNKDLRFLDACAAPGGKSLLLSHFLHNKGVLIANEIHKTRHSILRENLSRCALPNFLTSPSTAEKLGCLTSYFDVVLVDAPCSGEGMFRKDEQAREEWSEENVLLCEARQKNILAHIAPTVRQGGYLIYSTCTFSPQENEDMIAQLTVNGDWEKVRFTLPASWCIRSVDQPSFFGMQFLPHQVPGEGFFVTVLRKRKVEEKVHLHSFGKKHRLYWNDLRAAQRKELEKWLATDIPFPLFINEHNEVHLCPTHKEEIEEIGFHIGISQVGIGIGKFMRDEFIPDHGLAISRFYSPNVHSVELGLEEARSYLRREEFSFTSNHEGWAVATYQHQPLGWLKMLKNRINNYYPKELRIKHL
jgi:16S rRNA C967 or C1407 C5-methylase (RsmB/RsmF family)/NOL1/NOP2/fmu family ribosome biogenesis protein